MWRCVGTVVPRCDTPCDPATLRPCDPFWQLSNRPRNDLAGLRGWAFPRHETCRRFARRSSASPCFSVAKLVREMPGTMTFGARGFRPRGRATFFASPKKVAKERRPDDGAPLRGMLCGARGRGIRRTRPEYRPQTTADGGCAAPPAPLRSSTPSTGPDTARLAPRRRAKTACA